MDYYELAKQLIGYQFKLSRIPKLIYGGSIEQIRGEKIVLGYLIEVEDGVAPSQIGKFIGVTTARVANILNKLEDKGFITRSMDPNDRRKIIVTITDEGKKKVIEDISVIIEHMAKILAELGEHDAKEHIRIMKAIYNITLEHENEINND